METKYDPGMRVYQTSKGLITGPYVVQEIVITKGNIHYRLKKVSGTCTESHVRASLKDAVLTAFPEDGPKMWRQRRKSSGEKAKQKS